MKVSVVVAHGDDVIKGFLGSAILFAQKEAEISITVVTDGSRCHEIKFGCTNPSPQQVMVAREAELLRALEIAGVQAKVNFLRWRDGAGNHWRDDPILLALISKILEEEKPDKVYIPEESDQHVDHKAVNWISLQALASRTRKPEVYCILFDPGRLKGDEYREKTEMSKGKIVRTPIGPVLGLKRKAFRAMRSLIRLKPYPNWPKQSETILSRTQIERIRSRRVERAIRIK